jgi:hypothetical protein
MSSLTPVRIVLTSYSSGAPFTATPTSTISVMRKMTYTLLLIAPAHHDKAHL